MIINAFLTLGMLYFLNYENFIFQGDQNFNTELILMYSCYFSYLKLDKRSKSPENVQTLRYIQQDGRVENNTMAH